MNQPFELDWMGGPAEYFFRRKHPDDFPWGTLAPGDYPPEMVARARLAWTEGAFSEYCSAAAFAAILQALTAVPAPIDLTGMAGEFVADEMYHVELNARLAMELGGATPMLVDFSDLVPERPAELTALQWANELIIRTCCVGEALSVPLLGGTLRVATHPLVRAVLERIVQDEAPHAQLGWFYLEWVADRLDDDERRRLAGVALEGLQDFAPTWQRLSSDVQDGVTSEGYTLEQVHELGWMESGDYARTALHAVSNRVVAPLSRVGITIPSGELSGILNAA